MKNTTLDITEAPEWAFSIRMRGIEIPMRSPLEIGEDMPSSAIPTQAEIDRQLKRWPGLFVWIFRALFGGARFDRNDLPSDAGAAHTRRVVTAILGEHHRELIAELKTGECAQIIASYQGCQTRWMGCIHQWASELADQELGKLFPQRSAPTPRSSAVSEQLVPGGAVPAMLDPSRNPLVRFNPHIHDGGDSKA